MSIGMESKYRKVNLNDCHCGWIWHLHTKYDQIWTKKNFLFSAIFFPLFYFQFSQILYIVWWNQYCWWKKYEIRAVHISNDAHFVLFYWSQGEKSFHFIIQPKRSRFAWIAIGHWPYFWHLLEHRKKNSYFSHPNYSNSFHRNLN